MVVKPDFETVYGTALVVQIPGMVMASVPVAFAFGSAADRVSSRPSPIR